MTTAGCAASPVAGAIASTFAGVGFCMNCSTAERSAAAASAGPSVLPRASRSRRIARACSCETRDSFTPISRPMFFIVTSP
jgi:hypothetical protein